MSPLFAAVMVVASVLLLLIAKMRLAGFQTQKPADFAGQGPSFDPRTHLNGPILCEGVIYGPLGRVSSRFVAQMEGVWEGNRGVLNEVFHYSNGDRQVRQWRLTYANDGTLKAEADDLVGTGKGFVAGPIVQMLYNIRLPAASGGHVLKVNDWMYLAENGTIMNRSQFTKFGITVAELVATMRPMPATAA